MLPSVIGSIGLLATLLARADAEADGLEPGMDTSATEALDEVGREDLPGLGQCFEPSALDDGHPVDVAVRLGDLPGPDADPDAERGDRGCGSRVLPDGALHLEMINRPLG